MVTKKIRPGYIEKFLKRADKAIDDAVEEGIKRADEIVADAVEFGKIEIWILIMSGRRTGTTALNSKAACHTAIQHSGGVQIQAKIEYQSENRD